MPCGKLALNHSFFIDLQLLLAYYFQDILALFLVALA